MKSRSFSKLLLSDVQDANTQKNFNEISKGFDQFCPVAYGYITDTIALITGDNRVHVRKRATGRITVFQDAAVTIIDKGMVGDYWVVTASAPCNARFLFL